MKKLDSISRWNERRAASILNVFLSAQDDLTAKHAGESQDLDIRVYRGEQLIGMGEVKTDVDPEVAASKEALVKRGSSLLDLPPNSGEWGLTFKPSANVKRLKENVTDLIALANQFNLTFLSPESLWDESHSELGTKLEVLNISHAWRYEESTRDRVMLTQEPWGGLVPDECPSLQTWIDDVLSNHESKESMKILSSAEDLEQRHVVICIDSNSPVNIQLYAMHHALGLPSGVLKLPSWVTDLWILLPRTFQESDVAWRYSQNGGWSLFAPGYFLDV